MSASSRNVTKVAEAASGNRVATARRFAEEGAGMVLAVDGGLGASDQQPNLTGG